MWWWIGILGGGIAAKLLFSWMEQSMLYHPWRTLEATPADAGLAYTEVRIATRDARQIHGWYVSAPRARATVIFCHGNAGNISHRVHRAQFFYALGLNALFFDYRGYGQSTGRPREPGLYRDVEAVYDFLVEQKQIAPEQIIAYGSSLGGPVAAELCLRRKVGRLVLESTFASTVEVGKDWFWFLPLALLVTQKYDTVAKVKNILIPKLILHGQQDEVIGFRHGERVYAAAALPKRFLPFLGGHNDEAFVMSATYLKILGEFLDETMQRPH